MDHQTLSHPITKNDQRGSILEKREDRAEICERDP